MEVNVLNEETNNTEAITDLERYIKENSGIWDLTDVKEFLIYHKDDVLELLQRL